MDWVPKMETSSVLPKTGPESKTFFRAEVAPARPRWMELAHYEPFAAMRGGRKIFPEEGTWQSGDETRLLPRFSVLREEITGLQDAFTALRKGFAGL